MKDSTYLRVNRQEQAGGSLFLTEDKGPDQHSYSRQITDWQDKNIIDLLNDRFMDTGATENAVPETVGNPSGFCYIGM